MCRQWTRRVLARFLTPLVLSLLLSAVQGQKGSTKLAQAVRNEEVAPVTLKLPKRAGAACADAAGGSVCGRELVSVVTPTRGKTQKLHPLLYASFASQTYAQKELIVLDSSKRPSKFFTQLRDERVYYLHVVCRNTTLGMKRNRLAQLANGSILAHFDDDDWYAPEYLDVMVARLLAADADLVKLSGWFVYSCKLNYFGYFDPGQTAIFGEISDSQHGGLKYSLFLDPRESQVQTWVMGPSGEYDEKLRDETRYGFGFSYVYRKNIMTQHSFSRDITFGEDLHLIVRLIRSDVKIKHFTDTEGICLHIQGHWNTARIPTQYRIPTFLVPRILKASALNHTRC